MRKISILAVAGALLLLLCLAVGVIRPRAGRQTDTAQPGTHTIAVLGNLIHTDIAIRIDGDIVDRFGFLADAGIPINHPEARWLVIGWGRPEFLH